MVGNRAVVEPSRLSGKTFTAKFYLWLIFRCISGMKKAHLVIILAVILIAIAAITITLAVVLSKKDSSKGSVKQHPENEAYRYTKAAVATDSAICSKVCDNLLTQ